MSKNTLHLSPTRNAKQPTFRPSTGRIQRHNSLSRNALPSRDDARTENQARPTSRLAEPASPVQAEPASVNPTRLSVRINPRNQDHHLWNNNGTWWVHFTIHLTDYTKQRVRLSLETSDIDQARLRRDDLLARNGWKPRQRASRPALAA